MMNRYPDHEMVVRLSSAAMGDMDVPYYPFEPAEVRRLWAAIYYELYPALPANETDVQKIDRLFMTARSSKTFEDALKHARHVVYMHYERLLALTNKPGCEFRTSHEGVHVDGCRLITWEELVAV